jgi:hypothetical protein
MDSFLDRMSCGWDLYYCDWSENSMAILHGFSSSIIDRWWMMMVLWELVRMRRARGRRRPDGYLACVRRVSLGVEVTTELVRVTWLIDSFDQSTFEINYLTVDEDFLVLTSEERSVGRRRSTIATLASWHLIAPRRLETQPLSDNDDHPVSLDRVKIACRH